MRTAFVGVPALFLGQCATPNGVNGTHLRETVTEMVGSGSE